MRPLRITFSVLAGLALTAATVGTANSLRMPTATAPTVTVVAVGDVACAPGAATTATACRDAATAKLAESMSPDFVLSLGDQQYETGTYAAFMSEYDGTWGALKSITEPIPGNHEYKTSGASGYYKYFADRIPEAAANKGYYATTMGSWKILQLNSNCSSIVSGGVDCAAELTWFKKQLANTSEQCVAMTMHHPRYSSGKHGSSTVMRPFWRAAYAAKVDLALAGHDHDYERFKRLDGDKVIRTDGIPSFVVGTGGKELRTLGSRRYGSAYFNSKKHGVLKLSLGQGNFSYWFVGIDGVTYDVGTRSCV
ncbi:MAG TPA: metallophosphoesterase [Marmoricola sp.]|nr:metallophosphoesterase [Marmoricola sp.]